MGHSNSILQFQKEYRYRAYSLLTVGGDVAGLFEVLRVELLSSSVKTSKLYSGFHYPNL